MRLPVKVLAGAAVVLALFLGVGLVLPARWVAERSALVDAPPAAVFPLLDDVSRWDEWMPQPNVGSELFGPARGVGAGRSWDDPEIGEGVFTIVESHADRLVAYRVEVDGGAITIDGRLVLEARNGGTLVTWTERGDFGWNPLLRYMARAMDRLQGAELQKGLERLETVVEAGRRQPT